MKNKEKKIQPKDNGGGKKKNPVWDTYAWAIVFLFPVMLYLNTLSNGFNMDDELVTNNHRLTSQGISAIPEIFRSPYYQDAQGYQYEYRPVSQAIFAIQHSLLGEKPAVSHAMNVLLYGLLCVLLFSVLQALFSAYKQLNIAIVLLFAAHPAHTEVVASIKNREELLAFLFGFSAWWIAVRFLGKNIILALSGIFILMLTGVWCKPSIVPLVGLIPISLFIAQDVRKRIILLVYLVSAAAVVPWLNIAVPGVKILLVFIGLVVLLLLMIIHDRSLLGRIIDRVKSIPSAYAISQPNTDPHQNWHSLSLPLLYWGMPLWSSFFVLFFLPGLKIPLLLISWLWLAFIVHRRQHALFLFLFCVVSPILSHLLQLEHAYPCLIAFLFIPIKTWRERTSPLVFSDVYPLLLLLSLFALGITDSFITFLLLSILRILGWRIIWQALMFIDVLSLVNEAPYREMFQADPNWLRISGFVVLFYVFLFFVFKQPWVNYLKALALILCCAIWFSTHSPAIDVFSPLSPLTKPTISTDVRPLQFAEYPFTYLHQDAAKLATALDVSLRYVRLLVIPYPLSFYYGFSVIKPLTFADVTPWLAVLLWTALFALMIWFCRRNFRLLLALAILIGSILFFSNPLAFVPGMMGDRFLFLPVLGIAIIFSVVLFSKPQLRYLFWGVFVLFAGMTISRNTQWKDRFTLFTADIPHLDSSAQAHNMLGLEYVAQATKMSAIPDSALLRKAVFHFQQAVAIWPNFFNATYDLARIHMELKDYNQGLYWYQRAVRIDTSFSRCYTAMAFIYENRGDMDSAVWAYDRAITLRGDDLSVFTNYSFLLFRMKRLEESVAVNRKAMQFHPQSWEPVMNIGKTFIALQQFDSAEVYFTRAHALNNQSPTWEQVKAGLGSPK